MDEWGHHEAGAAGGCRILLSRGPGGCFKQRRSWHEVNCNYQCLLIHPMQLGCINVDKRKKVYTVYTYNVFIDITFVSDVGALAFRHGHVGANA